MFGDEATRTATQAMEASRSGSRATSGHSTPAVGGTLGKATSKKSNKLTAEGLDLHSLAQDMVQAGAASTAGSARGSDSGKQAHTLTATAKIFLPSSAKWPPPTARADDAAQGASSGGPAAAASILGTGGVRIAQGDDHTVRKAHVDARQGTNIVRDHHRFV